LENIFEYIVKKHNKWPELVPKIQDWLNSSVTATTGYAPVELFNGEPRPNIFTDILKGCSDQLYTEESVPQKVLHVYVKPKLKAENRNMKRKKGQYKWTPQLHDLVLVKQQPTADAIQGATTKFQRPYEGPYVIQNMINSTLFEVTDRPGKQKRLFNKKHLKPYLQIQNILHMKVTNKEDLDYWKVRPPPKHKKRIGDTLNY
jgi:hypothetical protein